jgi:hypothetical protein
MAVPLFPDLERMLIRVLGPTAAAIMLHQLLYWFRRPKMQDRWWVYKTFKEWRDERGLSRRQVVKGRQDLIKRGLIKEQYSPYKKVHIYLHWMKLAETLNLNPIAQPESPANRVSKPQTPQIGRAITDCTLRNSHEPHFHAGEPHERGVQTRLHGRNANNPAYLRGKSPEKGVQTNTEDYAIEYEQENPPLQGGAEAAFAAPAPSQSIQFDEEHNGYGFDALAANLTKQQGQVSEDEGAETASTGNAGPTPEPPRLDGRRKSEVWRLMEPLEGDRDSTVSRLTALHLKGHNDGEGRPITAEQIAEEVRGVLGGAELLEAYVTCVDDVLRLMREDVAV